MNKTSFDKGMEIGFERGIEKERRAVLRDILEERFGNLPPTVLQRIEALPFDHLEPLRKAAWKAQTIADLGLED